MPLDSGQGAHPIMDANGSVGAPDGERQSLDSLLAAGADVGQALRALREARGLSLQDIAETTCVRRIYLQAIEEMALDRLPSGPFAPGYVRAYAQALGIKPELAVARFRQAAPPPAQSQPLKAPMGVPKQRDARLSWLAGVSAVVAVTVGVWNLAQHAVAHDGGPTPPIPVTNAPAPAPLAAKGPVALGAPQPAPADSDAPIPYVTPGMAKAVGGAADPTPAPAKVAFNPHAAVYGAAADQAAAVTLRAVKAASLVIRGADGSIYFARQLSAGESYRAPASVKGLTIDVSDPQAFNVTVNGQVIGPLPAAQTPVGKLAG
jgi:cytoskeleton protein RodZ